MREAAGNEWVVGDFFVLRTPYLPLDALLALGVDLEAPERDGDDPEAAKRDLERVRNRLRVLIEREDVREALYLASPSLVSNLDEWRRDPAARSAGRMERSLLRYVSRMAARPTPFGLFAGWSIGSIGSTSTRIELMPQGAYRRHSSLDCSYLGALGEALRLDPSVRRRITYFPNSTLYEAAERFRYVEARGTAFHLVVVEPEPILRHVIETAATGGRPEDLAAAICAFDSRVDAGEAERFVDELITQQILVCDLEPTVTGPDPLDGLLDQLTGVAPHLVNETLGHVRELLRKLDAEPPGIDPARYGQIADALDVLPVAVDPSRLVRTDLIKPAHATLGKDLIGEISTSVELLTRVGGVGHRDPLGLFRNSFKERYGDREVSLCEVLDDECGLGYPTSNAPDGVASPSATGAPWLNGLKFPSAGEAVLARFSRRDELLCRWLWEASRDDASEIALGPVELAALEAADGERKSLPDAFSVMATVLAGSSDAVAEGRYRLHLSGVGGPSGANLMGRFCTGHDVLTARVRAHLRAEEALRPNTIFAEIVHLPQPRMGNVLSRPVLRDHEIPFFGRSGVPGDGQIPVIDLLVSVIGERVVLRSRRLDREIVPRLTAAHNFRSARNLSLYRFLCALQGQDTLGGVGPFFGALANSPYLPRVTAGRLIITRARWNLTTDDLRPLRTTQGSARFAAMQAMRRRLRLPRWVALVDGDKLLPLDLANVLFVDVAAELLKQRSGAAFVELFFGPDDILATGPEGRFVHELVVPFVRAVRPTTDPPRPSLPTGVPKPVVRRFPPGSEWLFTKLYSGTTGSDAVLRNVVGPVVEHQLSSGAVDGWFFVRYGDPDWHIRLRLHGDCDRLLGEVLPELLSRCAPHVASGLIWRVQLDTYEREVDRYGGPAGILLAERIFRADSEMVLGVIKSLNGDESADARWRLALVGGDRLLTDLGLSLADRYAIVRAARERFGQEFRVDIPFRRQLGERYRRERADLQRALGGEAAGASALHLARSDALMPIIVNLRAEVSEDQLRSLAGSLLHMHANRLLGSGTRPQELVIYDFLTRLYGSKLALENRPAGGRRSVRAGSVVRRSASL